ncbi:MAG TPA: hypothetical protein VH591_19725 [Ktedonobacterales bacterium]
MGRVRGIHAAANPDSGDQSVGDGISELPLKQYDYLMDASRYSLYTALDRARATDAWVELYLRRRE